MNKNNIVAIFLTGSLVFSLSVNAGVSSHTFSTDAALAGVNASSLLRGDIDARMTESMLSPRADGGALWLTPSYRVDEDSSKSPFKFKTKGVQLGADIQYGNAFFGVGYGYVKSEGDLESPVAAESDHRLFSLKAYGLYRFGQVYLKGSLGVMRDSDTFETGHAKTSDHVYSWSGDVGLYSKWQVSGFDVLPYVEVNTTYVRPEGSTDVKRFTLCEIPVGVKVAYAFEAHDWSVKPMVDLSYVRGAGDSDFEAYRIIGENTARASIGLEAKTRNFSLGFVYRYERARSDRQAHAGNVDLKYIF